ncbi:MAG: hypothetical protein ABI354_03410 [Candidatus Saccharimonadales bacterium]
MEDQNQDQNQQDASSAPITTAPSDNSFGFGAFAPPTTTTPTANDSSDSVAADLSTPELPSSSTPEIEADIDNSTSDDTKSSEADGELLDLKKQALEQLSPLVAHLDQSPEEKFRTTMMMIQASDNQSLIKDAFAAAKEITDDKARAQALLDVINEINYFTQLNSQK